MKESDVPETMDLMKKILEKSWGREGNSLNEEKPKRTISFFFFFIVLPLFHVSLLLFLLFFSQKPPLSFLFMLIAL